MEYYDEFVLFFGAGTVARPTHGIQWAGAVARPAMGMTEFRRVGHRADRPCEQRHSYERYSQNKFSLYKHNGILTRYQ
ncbi:MAG: hypothetical protein U5L07_15770 [Desulfobacterales bacterium]|nr:hypothetical protein [Desulfobacterales bacterium]